MTASDDRQRVAEQIEVRPLAASIQSKDTASITFEVIGEFERDGTSVKVEAVIVVTVPAKVLPA